MIRFTLKARTTGWVAVGFSDDRLMVSIRVHDNYWSVCVCVDMLLIIH